MRLWPRVPAWVGWTLLAVLVVGAVATRVLYVRAQSYTELADLLEVSLVTGESETSAWAEAQRDRVVMASQLVAGRDWRDPAAVRDVARLLDGLVDAMRRRGAVGAVAAIDENGKVITTARAGTLELPPPSVWDTSSTAAATGSRRCGPRLCVVFREPVHWASGTGWMVLWVAVDDDTFRALNPATRQNRTGRTSLVARIDDSLAVLASRSNAARPVPRMLAWESVPPHVGDALAGRATKGHGPGLFGADAIYAAAPVQGTPWAVVRELESAEVLHNVDLALAIEETILVALFLSVVFLIRNRVRAVRQRRTSELTQLRADFVSSVSHELRTPLAQIRMFAELLRKGSMRTPEDADRALRIIEKEASRLTILVDNILNYTRLRKRSERVPTHPAYVTGEVRQAIESFGPLSAERGVTIVPEIEPDLWATVDSLALRQVLVNFLENAAKYGPRGQKLTVGAKGIDDVVRVWVDDQGPGIPPSEREKVWRAFYRRREAVDAGATGAGIGLAVVRELVLQHGGRVEVTDAPNGGARFVADLPRAEVPVNALDLMTTGERPIATAGVGVGGRGSAVSADP
ncbi:MAG TPA: HAMP domain-containing sensor histidine kinase [Gemmatimonadaceae bacterium]